MGRIIAEINDNKFIVTKYESNGFIIPDKITQEKKIVATIVENLDYDAENEVVEAKDLAVSRKEFISEMISKDGFSEERYLKYVRGLYSRDDMMKGITWAEASYLLHYVAGYEKAVKDWNKIKPRSKDKVCVIHEVIGNEKVLDERLASYKNRLDIERYIKSIIAGNRYIPLPLYCAYYDLMCRVNADTELSIDLDMMFKKVSQEELKVLW